jgi:hypothetical protein
MYIHTYTQGLIPIQAWEFPVFVLIVFCTFLWGRQKVKRNIAFQPELRYLIPAMLAKIFGGFLFACIYVFYYKQGDTTCFYECSLAFCKLFQTDFNSFWAVFWGEGTQEMKSYFNAQTGEPMMFMFGEGSTRFVMKLLIPFMLLAGHSYFITTTLISIFTFGATWTLYRVFLYYFPQHYRLLAWPILFMPSVVFWGSGILKDSFTLSATCYFIYFTHRLVIGLGSKIFNVLLLGIAAFFILSIKAYILLILLPSSLVWLFYSRIRKIRNPILRVILVPGIYISIILGSYFIFANTGDYFGKFSIDRALKTASITQNDLKQEYYQGNSFDIGDWEPSLAGALGKFPQATIAGLYRPWIYESKNIVMLFSGLENLFIFGSTIYALFGIHWRRFRRLISDYPIVLYSLLFAVFFGFMIGLSTSNFGALVRFKIPLIPLYMSAILLIISNNKNPIETKVR